MNRLPGFFSGVTTLFLLVILSGSVLKAAAPDYIGVAEIADELGMSLEWTEPDRSVRLTGSGVNLDFRVGSKISQLNGIKVFLGQGVLANQGKLYLSMNDWKLSLQPILMPRLFPDPPGFRRVMIDAGHGGSDPGGQNKGMGLNEKDYALSVSRLIGARLQQEGFEVGYTRTTDTFIPLKTRPALSNRAQADIFLSVHFNAATESVRGVETYAYTLQGDPSSARSNVEPADRARYPANLSDPWNALLGYYIQRELVGETRLPDRGLKRARFSVLEDLNSPGVLLELGFISNNQTATLLRSAEFQNRLADAVVRGVRKYRQTLVRLHQRDQ